MERFQGSADGTEWCYEMIPFSMDDPTVSVWALTFLQLHNASAKVFVMTRPSRILQVKWSEIPMEV